MTNALKAGETTSIKHLTYTPVTNETFAKWCDQYKERLKIIRDSKLTELDSKPTGKQLFLMNMSGVEDLTIEDEDIEELDPTSELPSHEDDEEEQKSDEEEFKIDRTLFEAEDLEEVDFDDE